METVSCTREIAVEKDYDVVVLGGGPSGLMAAAAAAKAGAIDTVVIYDISRGLNIRLEIFLFLRKLTS